MCAHAAGSLLHDEAAGTSKDVHGSKSVSDQAESLAGTSADAEDTPEPPTVAEMRSNGSGKIPLSACF